MNTTCWVKKNRKVFAQLALHKWQHLFVIDWMMFPLFPIKFGTLWSMESEQYFLLLQFFKATNEMAQKCAHFFPLEIKYFRIGRELLLEIHV